MQKALTLRQGLVVYVVVKGLERRNLGQKPSNKRHSAGEQQVSPVDLLGSCKEQYPEHTHSGEKSHKLSEHIAPLVWVFTQSTIIFLTVSHAVYSFTTFP